MAGDPGFHTDSTSRVRILCRMLAEVGRGKQIGTRKMRPAFERCWARIGGRPAARRAREPDDAPIPAEWASGA